MRITFIAAGAGINYCGACARDITLVRGLMKRGHDVTMLPLYMPLRCEGPSPADPQVFYGGINAYLQQHFRLFRRTTGFLDWLVDRPALLQLVSRFAMSTSPGDLGAMTVSVLLGAEGRQRKELEKLLGFLQGRERPDVVNLTNSLLSGLARPMKRRLRAPVVCSLQGEDAFIDRLGEPYRTQARELLHENAKYVDGYIAPSRAYANQMAAFLDVAADRITVVYPGLDLDPFANQAARVREPFRVGYLSRIAPEKGLHVLCEAFRLMDDQSAQLAIAGQVDRANAAYRRKLRQSLSAAGLAGNVAFLGELSYERKISFLQGCSVFVQPSCVPEPRGTTCIEAMGAGVPVIAPRSGVFPEMLALTDGGILVPPDDPQALAGAIAVLRDDPGRADRLGRSGAERVRSHFCADAMTAATLGVYGKVLGAS